MGIEFDSAYSATAGGDTLVFSVTVSEANSMIILGLGDDSGPALNPPAPTITFDGDNFTFVDYHSEGGVKNAAVWYLYNPSVGTFNIECGFSTPGSKAGIACVYKNTASTITTYSNDGGTGETTMTQTLTNPSDRAWLFGVWTGNDQDITASTGTTERGEGGSGSTTYRTSAGDSNGELLAGSQSLEATVSSSHNWGGVLVVIPPNNISGSAGGGVAYSGGASFSF